MVRRFQGVGEPIKEGDDPSMGWWMGEEPIQGGSRAIQALRALPGERVEHPSPPPHQHHRSTTRPPMTPMTMPMYGVDQRTKCHLLFITVLTGTLELPRPVNFVLIFIFNKTLNIFKMSYIQFLLQFEQYFLPEAVTRILNCPFLTKKSQKRSKDTKNPVITLKFPQNHNQECQI